MAIWSYVLPCCVVGEIRWPHRTKRHSRTHQLSLDLHLLHAGWSGRCDWHRLELHSKRIIQRPSRRWVMRMMCSLSASRGMSRRPTLAQQTPSIPSGVGDVRLPSPYHGPWAVTGWRPYHQNASKAWRMDRGRCLLCPGGREGEAVGSDACSWAAQVARHPSWRVGCCSARIAHRCERGASLRAAPALGRAFEQTPCVRDVQATWRRRRACSPSLRACGRRHPTRRVATVGQRCSEASFSFSASAESVVSSSSRERPVSGRALQSSACAERCCPAAVALEGREAMFRALAGQDVLGLLNDLLSLDIVEVRQADDCRGGRVRGCLRGQLRGASIEGSTRGGGGRMGPESAEVAPKLWPGSASQGSSPAPRRSTITLWHMGLHRPSLGMRMPIPSQRLTCVVVATAPKGASRKSHWSDATVGLWWRWAGHVGRLDAVRLASRTARWRGTGRRKRSRPGPGRAALPGSDSTTDIAAWASADGTTRSRRLWMQHRGNTPAYDDAANSATQVCQLGVLSSAACRTRPPAFTRGEKHK